MDINFLLNPTLIRWSNTTDMTVGVENYIKRYRVGQNSFYLLLSWKSTLMKFSYNSKLNSNVGRDPLANIRYVGDGRFLNAVNRSIYGTHFQLNLIGSWILQFNYFFFPSLFLHSFDFKSSSHAEGIEQLFFFLIFQHYFYSHCFYKRLHKTLEHMLTKVKLFTCRNSDKSIFAHIKDGAINILTHIKLFDRPKRSGDMEMAQLGIWCRLIYVSLPQINNNNYHQNTSNIDPSYRVISGFSNIMNKLQLKIQIYDMEGRTHKSRCYPLFLQPI